MTRFLSSILCCLVLVTSRATTKAITTDKLGETYGMCDPDVPGAPCDQVDGYVGTFLRLLVVVLCRWALLEIKRLLQSHVAFAYFLEATTMFLLWPLFILQSFSHLSPLLSIPNTNRVCYYS